MPRIYEYASCSSGRLYCTDPDLIDKILDQILTIDPKSRKYMHEHDYGFHLGRSEFDSFSFMLDALLDAGYEPFAVNGSAEIHLRKNV